MSSLNFILCYKNQMSARFAESSNLSGLPSSSAPSLHTLSPAQRAHTQSHAHHCKHRQSHARPCKHVHAFAYSNTSPCACAIAYTPVQSHAIACAHMCTPVCLSLSVPIRVSLCSRTLPKHTISPDSTVFALNGCCQHKSLAATVTEPDCSARIVISELLCVCNYGRKP